MCTPEGEGVVVVVDCHAHGAALRELSDALALIPPAMHGAASTMHISTKYYDAAVRVQAEHAHSFPAFTAPCDALVVLAGSGPLPAAVSVALRAYIDTHQPHILLCACAVDCPDAPSLDHLPAFKLCADTGMEFVPLLPDLPPPREPAQDTECEGLDRVREALHAHVWPGHTLKRRDEEERARVFEDTLAMMSQLRDTSAKMPDSERREFAARVALSMWECLGEDDDEDE
mmetsp:Transcript_16195/g.41569  ORF Transcript_16195/g.41569 Transcript_16195/m.41569 type:complete len:230 (+) Transcript_16195:111-800(+)